MTMWLWLFISYACVIPVEPKVHVASTLDGIGYREGSSLFHAIAKEWFSGLTSLFRFFYLQFLVFFIINKLDSNN